MVSYVLPPWPPPQPSEPRDLPPDPQNLVCGLACSLANWRPDELENAAARSGDRVPLRCNHEDFAAVISGPGAADVGRVLRLAYVPPTGDGLPGGLLVLAEVSAIHAPWILAGMRNRGEWMAMSIRGKTYEWPSDPPGTPRALELHEVSLVSRVGEQADENALVLGSGPAALTVWELLTGEAVTL
jgi:hypothetical protein